MLEVGIEGKGEEASYAMSAIKQIFGTLEDITSTVTVKFTRDMLKIQVIDSMHVCLVDIQLITGLFTHYRCDKDIIVTIPLKIFNTILKNCNLGGKECLFMLSCVESSVRQVEVKTGETEEPTKEEIATANQLNIVNEIDGTMTKFTVDLLESEIPQYMAPNTDWSSTIDVTSEGFKLFKNFGDLFGTKIIFKVQKNEFILQQQGDGTFSDIVLVADDENKPYTIDSTAPCSIEIKKLYLNCISKIFSLSEEMKISMKEEHPISFELRLNDFGYVQFFIAPQA